MVNAQLTLFPDARHELWMERDHIRSAFLSAIFELF
jgi:alpha-beta hydrolase superfamily lysophospholipase